MSNLQSVGVVSIKRPVHRVKKTKLEARREVAQAESRDWLDLQEEQEVDALITHMGSQRERSMKLEAYD